LFSSPLTDLETKELHSITVAGYHRLKSRLISITLLGGILMLIYPVWIIVAWYIPVMIAEIITIRAEKIINRDVGKSNLIQPKLRNFYFLFSWAESLCFATLFIAMSVFEGQIPHFIPYIILLSTSIYVATTVFQNAFLMFGHLTFYNIALVIVATRDVLIAHPNINNGIWAQFFASLLLVYFLTDSYLFFHKIHLKNRAKSLEIDKARKHAEILTQQKSDLISAIGHELRTPLNGILGFSQVIKRTKLTKKQREYMDLIESAGKDLHLLLSNVLDSEALEQGRLHLHTHDTNIPVLLNRTLKIFEDAAYKKGIYLKLEIEDTFPTHIKIDETRLGQCVSNLLSNAVRFTQTGGITVNARYKNGTESILSITVTDTGIGVPEDQKIGIFEKYVQGKNQSTSQNSTGLGLWLIKSVAQAMNGTIELLHTSSTGSVFQLEFDLGHQTLEILGEHQHLNNLRILHIEDIETNALLVRATLDGTGGILTEAKTGEYAMALLNDKEFDIVICDMQLPDCDGNQVLDYIRQLHNNNAKIPVIALTAQPEKINRTNYQTEFTAILQKPVAREVLLSSLSTLSNDNCKISE
jgi:signal transduction histidine kinase/CheY-like chemotaxis protein